MAAHYLRCLELCNKLTGQFEILFAYSSRYIEFIKACGFETFKVDNFNPEEVSASALRFDFSWLNKTNIEHILTSQIKTIEEHKPNIVLGDAAFTLKMAAEQTKVPYVSLLNGYMTKYCSITRQVSPSHPGYPYSKTMPKKVFERLTRMIERIMFEKVHAPFRTVRKNLKLSKLNYLLEELEGDFNLICDLPEFFPQKKLPENYDYIGPLFYKGKETEKEIEEFLNNNHQPLLISMGSTGAWKNLSLMRDPAFSDFHLVVSGNGSSSLSGDNILNRTFINHTGIMPKISLLICHGGNGTVYQALSHGVPVLFFPGNFEQEWNIQRITAMELGARIEDSQTATEIRQLINEWSAKKGTAPFIQVQQSIKSFTDRPIAINHNRFKQPT
jgi:UDP:flavonoid glycosyltransferase YjiC (YdhE family)